MTIDINRENLTEALREAVAEKGEDFIYPYEWKDGNSCQYVLPKDGTAACLFGNALIRLGVPLHVLLPMNTNGISSVLRRLDVSDSLLLEACVEAQMAQDEGTTWGQAMATYEKELSDDIEDD